MIQSLSNENLVERFGKLVRTERKITHLVLECIAEIDRRRLYLDRAYPSLFEYLTREFGYSASAAQRRIVGARLLREIPEVAGQIESGSINLSQVGLLVQSVQAVEKQNNEKISPVEKVALLHKIENLSFANSEQVIRQELGVIPVPTERTQMQADGSVTMTMTLTKEEFELWQQTKALCAHSAPSAKNAEVLIHLAKTEVQRRTEIKRQSPQVSKSSTNPRQIPPNIRKILLSGKDPVNNDTFTQNLTRIKSNIQKTSTSESEVKSGCSFKDPETSRRCGSRHFLQIDHRQPVGRRHS